MIRIAIDHDADGSFALVTRPGAPAERIPITHRDAVRLMSEAAQVVLAVSRYVQKMHISAKDHFEDDLAMVECAPPHFIGALGE